MSPSISGRIRLVYPFVAYTTFLVTILPLDVSTFHLYAPSSSEELASVTFVTGVQVNNLAPRDKLTLWTA